jgi:hypothetical protein
MLSIAAKPAVFSLRRKGLQFYILPPRIRKEFVAWLESKGV